MKKSLPKILYIWLAAMIILVQIPFGQVSAATSEAVQVVKTVNPSEIIEGGEVEVKLDVKGSGDVNFVKPNDIILIIDRSGSMGPSYGPNNGEDKMKNAKDAAKGFIDLVDFSKHRVGVVDFASNISFKDFSTNPAELKQYINGIQANGGTGTRDAIRKAQQMLANHREDAQPVIILMTDGEATEPSPNDYARQVALEQANLAKLEGVVFYTIALLLPSENPDVSGPNLLMKEMATTAHHHHFVLGSVGLAEIYAAIVSEIGIASAYDVVVKDTVASEFEIVPGSYLDNIPQPVVNGNTLTFSFNELKEQTLTLTYKIRHKAGSKVGNISVGGPNIDVTYKDFSGAPHRFDVSHPTVKVNYPAPEITSVVEEKGLISGGEVVVINGKNFLPNPKVYFGNSLANTVQFVDSTKLIVTTPKAVQGKVVVKVTNTDGQSATSQYQYIANPIVTSIQPTIGPLEGQTKVTINGSYFLPGATVKFGEAQGTVLSVTQNQIIVNTPSSSIPQSVDVIITNPDETSVTVSDGFTYVLGPEITSVAPNKGLTLGGENVTLSGNHFIDGAKVYFNNTLVPSTLVSNSEISLTTPSWPIAETVNVKLVNPDGQEVTLNSGYQYVYPKPVILSITPSEGDVSGNLLIDIKGEHFLNNAKVYFDNVQLTNVTFYSSNQLKVRTPQWDDAGIVDVKVVNPDGQEDIKTDGFTYKLPAEPQIQSITPVEGPLSGGTQVKVLGTNLKSDINLFLGATKVTIQSNNGTELIFTTPKASTPGKVDVKIVDKYNRESTLPEAFEYLSPPPEPEPTILSITPNEGEMAGGYNAVIKGTNFEGKSVVFVNNIAATTTFYSSTELRIRVPASTTSGAVDVKVLNSSGKEAVAPQAFTYLAPPQKAAPEISSVTPNEGAMQGGYIIKILGSNFDPTAKVYFDNGLLKSTFYSSNELRVTVPVTQTPGAVDVKVVNADGQEFILPDAFTYLAPPPPPAPTITSVTPNEGNLDGGYYIVVKGTNYTNSSVVQIDDVPVQTIFYSASELRGRVPASTEEKTVDVKVVNSDGQSATADAAFTYVAPPPPPGPEIASLSPSSGVMTGGYYSFVNGSNFNSGSKVYINGKAASTVYYSPEQLRALVPASDIVGAVTVKVVNGDGQEFSLADGFTYLAPPPPSITEINPNNGEMSGGSTIIIKGNNFNATSIVYINNIAVQTTFFSTTELRAKTPKVNQPGPVDVQVINSDGQETTITGGFTYNSPPPAPAPVITTITPNTGQMAGGYFIVIKGSNFDANTKVFINNVEVQTVFYSVSEVRGRVPAVSVSGSVDVRVVNKDAQYAEVVGGFTYEAPPMKPAPTITSVTPNTGPATGGSFISIKGANYEAATKVYINNINVQTIFYSSGEVRARVPAGTAGSVDIKVENSDGQYVLLVNGYTYQ